MEKIFLVFFTLMLIVIFVLVIDFGIEQTNNRNICSELGGIPVFGDKGHFKVCLSPDAVIEMPK